MVQYHTKQIYLERDFPRITQTIYKACHTDRTCNKKLELEKFMQLSEIQ